MLRPALILPLLLALSGALVLQGCSSVDPEVSDSAGVSTGEIQVGVWSELLKRRVPAAGTLVNLGEGASRPLDTRGTPEAVQTFTELPPGQYEVRVERRFSASGSTRVTGSARVYLEPGASETLSVVVSETSSSSRGSADLKRRHAQRRHAQRRHVKRWPAIHGAPRAPYQSPKVAALPLPLEQPPG